MLAEVARHLADLTQGGVPIPESLELAASETSNHRLATSLRAASRAVEEGRSPSAALADHERTVGSLFVRMVHSSESIGQLPNVLRRLADHLDGEEQLIRRVRTAFVYPSILVGMGIVTITVLVTYVVPRLRGLFDELGQGLPALTRVLLYVSESSAVWAPILGVFLLGGIVVARRLVQRPSVRHRLDRFRWQLPVVGRLHRARELERFARTMHLLIANSAPLTEALATASRTAGSSLVVGAIEDLRRAVTGGESVGATMKRLPVFDRSATQLVAVAEEANDLAGGFERLGQRCQRDLDHATRLVTTVVEPALVVAVGCAVALVVFAMMLPIFQIDISGASQP
jgi:type II secretory pathway component PulF